jgi:flagellar hook protein FlgE
MLRSLDSAVSGLQQFQNELDVIGNNIANANTVGFKSARVDFEDTFSQTLQVASANSSGGGGGAVANMQIGSGVTTGAITNSFAEGALTSTNVQTDLAINGDGFFEVRDSSSGEQYATRAGDFKVDSSGYLVSNNGYRVQGFSDAGLATRGDIKIDITGAPSGASPTATVKDFSVGNDGKINLTLSDGTTFVRGQVLLQNFSNPQALLKRGSNLYSGMSAAGPLAQSAAPSSSGLGELKSSMLEQSNVDLTVEFTNLITTQRAFQANARVVTTSDEVLQELVGLKR